MYAYRSDVLRPRIRLNALGGTFLWALIRRRPKNEKTIDFKRVLKQFVAVLRPVIFMQTVVFLILKFRFSLGEILPRRTNVRLPGQIFADPASA